MCCFPHVGFKGNLALLDLWSFIFYFFLAGAVLSKKVGTPKEFVENICCFPHVGFKGNLALLDSV